MTKKNRKLDTVIKTEIIKTRALAKAKKVIEDVERLEKDFAAFFAACPEVESLSWTQYTPHFNDGDACVFSVHELREHGQRYDDSSDWAQLFGSSRWNRETKAYDDTPGKYSVSILPDPRSYDEDLMLELFGDHAVVTAHRDGTFSTDYYSHD